MGPRHGRRSGLFKVLSKFTAARLNLLWIVVATYCSNFANILPRLSMRVAFLEAKRLDIFIMMNLC